ncbi:MAG TPA: fibronectin type III domain-containing protein [Terriglobia bacterium]
MCWVVLFMSVAASISAQTIYWKKDHIYNGPGGKEIAVVMPQPTDQTAPTAPTNLALSTTCNSLLASVTPTTVQLSWTGSTDNVGVAGYKVYRQQGSGASLPVGTVTGTCFVDQPLTPSASYTWTIVAYDNAENHSAPSTSVSTTTLAAPADTTAPSTPTAFQAQSLTWSSVQLSWNPSVDTGGSGLANYRVYRNGTLIGSPTATLLTDTGLSAATTYNYAVSAVDVAGNVSGSAMISFTTPRVLVFSDNFNRSDASGTLNNSNWSGNGGPYWGISGGRADLPTSYAITHGAGWAFAVAAVSQTHVSATALLYAPSYYNYVGLTFWMSGYAGYRVYLNPPSQIRLSYFDSSNTESYIAAAALTGSGPWVVNVQANDSSRLITVSVNGVQQISFTETNMARGNSGYVGIAAYMSTSPGTDDMVDNFTLEQ